MSSIVINGDTSGSITLQAPAIAGSNTVTLPATTGYLFVNPAPGTLAVSNGGTGVADLTTAYGVLAAGTTTTGAVQNIGTGTSGQILKSNGPGVLPSFQAAAAGGFSNMTVFTAPGTFTTPATTTQIKVTVVGSGGGGGGTFSTGPGIAPVTQPGAGGAAGGAAIYVGPVTASTPYAVTVGAAAAGGAASTSGTTGNTSSFGAVASATGGVAGTSPGAPGFSVATGGVGTAGTLLIRGGSGAAYGTTSLSYVAGGASMFGGIGAYGSGGSGGIPSVGPGGTSTAGVVIVEY